jgi:hypothetical protein
VKEMGRSAGKALDVLDSAGGDRVAVDLYTEKLREAVQAMRLYGFE